MGIEQLSNYESSDIKQEYQKLLIATMDQLKGILQDFKIDIDQWGKEKAKNMEDLYDEITQGETILASFENKESTDLTRIVEVVAIDVFDPTGRLKLKEQKQTFADGRTRLRVQKHSVSEKVKPEDTDHYATALRALYEELGISADVTQIKYIGKKTEVQESSSYPGLKTCYQIHHFIVQLNNNQFVQEGYVEQTKLLTSYFVWKTVKQVKSSNSV
jgi:hypothetical protein